MALHGAQNVSMASVSQLLTLSLCDCYARYGHIFSSRWREKFVGIGTHNQLSCSNFSLPQYPHQCSEAARNQVMTRRGI
ncbi:hypothetical protein EI94DRAFT_1666485 [Lactarius quietus]|nr:hypothetical protein EI94DRAFT_1666485 [Lactarius quietus]